MQHTAQTEGFGIRLRPVRLEDAAFIVWARNLEHVKGRIGDSAATKEAQESWLRAYFQRPGDYYFIVETIGGIPVGTYGVYNIKGTSGESGRWVIRQDVLAAIPSAILAIDLDFGSLGLTELRVTTVATNRPVLSLNRKFGFREIRIDKDAQTIGGQPVDLVHFLLEAKDWPPIREKLLPFAEVAALQIAEWQRGQSSVSNPQTYGTKPV
jgi:RimJ/RimL family protein N-acetyltransferase